MGAERLYESEEQEVFCVIGTAQNRLHVKVQKHDCLNMTQLRKRGREKRRERKKKERKKIDRKIERKKTK